MIHTRPTHTWPGVTPLDLSSGKLFNVQFNVETGMSLPDTLKHKKPL